MTIRSEFQIISEFFAPLASAPGSYGLTDDAAVLDIPESHQLVVTSDTVISGVHFLDDDLPGDVACKALRVNLSDLAAMGAAPFGFFWPAPFSRAISEEWVARFAEGLAHDASNFVVPSWGEIRQQLQGKLHLRLRRWGLFRVEKLYVGVVQKRGIISSSREVLAMLRLV